MKRQKVRRETLTGAEIIVRALEDEAIPFAFGIPGTHNIELYDALISSKITHPVLVTDEQSASFMADAVWRASGKLACVNVVPGAGLTHALSGIAEAYMDQIPMLVLGCGIRHDTGKAYQLHDIDQTALIRPVVKQTFRPLRGEDLYGTIRKACLLARKSPCGPVFVEVPANLYMFQHDVALEIMEDQVRPRLDEQMVQESVAILNTRRQPLLYLGYGALGAHEELVPLAEHLEALVITTVQGKGLFPENHPLFLWNTFGKAAPPSVQELVDSCDCMLAIGCRFGEIATGSYGLTPPEPLIHVDIDESVLGRNYPARLPVPADARAFIMSLLRKIPARAENKSLRQRVETMHKGIEATWLEQSSATAVTPHRLLRAVQDTFGPSTIFSADSGNGLFLCMEHLRLTKPRQFLAPVDYSCMGYSVPAAIGAKLARPELPVVAVVGDGAFLMTGLETLTAASQKIPVLFIILRDQELSQIAQFQKTALNRTSCANLAPYELSHLGQASGIDTIRVLRDADIAGALQTAKTILAEGKPVFLEVAIDTTRKTYFTRGVVKTNFGRLPWSDRVRFIKRAVTRHFSED